MTKKRTKWEQLEEGMRQLSDCVFSDPNQPRSFNDSVIARVYKKEDLKKPKDENKND